MPYLVTISSPDGEVREFPLPEGETSIGRDPSNGLVLEGRGVSRRHAKFIVEGDWVSIVDIGSTYGTRVNDVPTMRRELALGDQLTIGMHRLALQQAPSAFDLSEHPTLLESRNDSGFSDDVTQDPRLHERSGQERTRSLSQKHPRGSEQSPPRPVEALPGSKSPSVQFVADDADQSEQVMVLSRDSDLLAAVERLNSPESALNELKTPTAELQRAADYQALVLMYNVSALLAAATDLDSFVAPMADMMIDAVNASTVVVLLVGEENDLVPRVIRHRGALHPGEVPVSRGILNIVLRNKETVIISDVGDDDRIKAGQSLALYNVRSVVAAPLMVRNRVRGVLYLNRSGILAFSSADGDLVAALASLLASGIEQSELKEQVAAENNRRKALERFHPPEVVDRIFRSGDQIGVLEEHRATAMVCNLQGFAELARSLEARQVARLLHEYYEMLYEKIFANGGSLVKLHDGWALALFGAPQSSDRDAVWAVEAALSLCGEFEALTSLWPGAETLQLSCTLDTGPVLAGFVGPAERLEYAALGSPISNTTSLAEHADETSLLVTEQTWSELPQMRYKAKEVKLPGKRRAYRLMIPG